MGVGDVGRQRARRRLQRKGAVQGDGRLGLAHRPDPAGVDARTGLGVEALHVDPQHRHIGRQRQSRTGQVDAAMRITQGGAERHPPFHRQGRAPVVSFERHQ